MSLYYASLSRSCFPFRIMHINNLPMVYFLLGPGVAAFALTFVLTWLMRSIAPRVGLVDRPGGRKGHDRPTPLGGGVAIFLGTWMAIFGSVAVGFVLLSRFSGLLPVDLGDYIGGGLNRFKQLLVILVGAVVVAGAGLVDDRRGLSPWIKLILQSGVALMLVFSDMQITLFFGNPWFSGLLTVLWVVGITNAFNLLDNMDGLSAGVALIISAMLAVLGFQTGQFLLGTFALVICGTLAGFLCFNFAPASIFMGDCGSTLVGYLLAVLSVELTFFHPDKPLLFAVVPLLIFAVPLFDTMSVVVIRLEAGRSPFVGDTNHFSHRLVRLGMSPRQAVLTIYLVTIAMGLGATILYHTTTAGSVVALVQALAVIAIIIILESAGRRGQNSEGDWPKAGENAECGKPETRDP